MSAKAILEYQQRILRLEEALLLIANAYDPQSLASTVAFRALEETE